MRLPAQPAALRLAWRRPAALVGERRQALRYRSALAARRGRREAARDGGLSVATNQRMFGQSANRVGKAVKFEEATGSGGLLRFALAANPQGRPHLHNHLTRSNPLQTDVSSDAAALRRAPSATLPRLRRVEASAYLLQAHGLRVAPASLAKMATCGGGPRFNKVTRAVYYPVDELDIWAIAKLGGTVGNTSEVGERQAERGA